MLLSRYYLDLGIESNPMTLQKKKNTITSNEQFVKPNKYNMVLFEQISFVKLMSFEFNYSLTVMNNDYLI